MSRVRPILAAVLLVVASTTAALAVGGSVSAPVEPGDDPVVGTSENSTRVLLLTEADAASFEEPSTSVTASLQSGHAQLSTSYELKRVEARLEAVESDAERQSILENATAMANERLTALQERERTARGQYTAGEISTTEYVLALGSIHAEASELISIIGSTGSEGTLYAYAGQLSGNPEIRPMLSRVRTQLVGLKGPVRELAASVIHGDRDSVRIHVTAGNGVMLSTIQGDRYIRETYRPDNLVDETAEFGDVPGLVSGYYPWVQNNTIGGSSFTLSGQYASQYTANHPHGTLEIWLSAASERVYVERQTLRLSQLPSQPEIRNTQNNTTLSASRTYAGGPLLIRVQNETGSRVDATVSLDGRPLGETDSEGRLWALSPAGDYNVTATLADGESLRVSVTARPAPTETES